MDYTQLLGLPIEIIALAIICYTIVQVATLIVNRKRDKIDLARPRDEKKSPEPQG